MENNLKHKHKVFVEYYLKDGNATRAYLAAYPNVTETSAAELGSKLLRNIKIAEVIKKAQDELKNELRITKEDLLRDLQEIKDAQKSSNASAAIKAIEVMGKMLGMFETKVDVTSKGEKIKIELNLGNDGDDTN